MKKTLLKISAAIVALAIAGVASAATPGTYIGGGLGYSSLGTPNTNLVTGPQASLVKQSHDNNGWGERAFVGYNFNEYFGIEGGYAHYEKATYKASNPLVGSASYENYFQDVNLVGKAYLPVYDTGINAYALGGIAYVHNYEEAHKNPIIGGAQKSSKTTNQVRPTYGVGVSYDIPQTQLTTNVEFARVQNSGNTIPSANLVTFNLAYNFG